MLKQSSRFDLHIISEFPLRSVPVTGHSSATMDREAGRNALHLMSLPSNKISSSQNRIEIFCSFQKWPIIPVRIRCQWKWPLGANHPLGVSITRSNNKGTRPMGPSIQHVTWLTDGQGEAGGYLQHRYRQREMFETTRWREREREEVGGCNMTIFSRFQDRNISSYSEANR